MKIATGAVVTLERRDSGTEAAFRVLRHEVSGRTRGPRRSHWLTLDVSGGGQLRRLVDQLSVRGVWLKVEGGQGALHLVVVGQAPNPPVRHTDLRCDRVTIEFAEWLDTVVGEPT